MSGNGQENQFAVLKISDTGSGDKSVPLPSDEFKKELVSVLKSQPQYTMRLDKFWYIYEQHFGKPFNVMEHGYTKHKALFMALPDIVKVYEDENRTNRRAMIKLKPCYGIDILQALVAHSPGRNGFQVRHYGPLEFLASLGGGCFTASKACGLLSV